MQVRGIALEESHNLGVRLAEVEKWSGFKSLFLHRSTGSNIKVMCEAVNLEKRVRFSPARYLWCGLVGLGTVWCDAVW